MKNYIFTMEPTDSIIFFIKIMNEKASKLGALNTHFSNPDGYDNDDHYSTAYDIALITKEAMKYKAFRNIVSLTEFKIKENKYEYNNYHKWYNTNQLILPYSNYYFKYATGIKTGTTPSAGCCLVSSAKLYNNNVIAVVLNSTETGRWTDSIKLLLHGIK